MRPDATVAVIAKRQEPNTYRTKRKMRVAYNFATNRAHSIRIGRQPLRKLADVLQPVRPGHFKTFYPR